MQADYIIDSQENSRLVIFFTGWSTGKNIADLFELPPGYDLIVCWDYRNISWSKLNKNYEEVLIFAWSFGVPVVEELFDRLSEEFNITGVYAINGSRFPVNDDFGISEYIFNETLKNLDEKNLLKFKIRIAGGIKNFQKYQASLSSELSIFELKEELKVFSELNPSDSFREIWDCAFISTYDKIFPPVNLEKAWHGTPIIRMPKENHLPIFSIIFNQTVKNKTTIRKNFERSLPSYNDTATVQKILSHKLVDLLRSQKLSYKHLLELGSGNGFLSSLLIQSFNPDEILLMDLSPKAPLKDAKYISGDIETNIHLIPKDSFDLVVSGSTMQWFHSPSRILGNLFQVLRKDGIVGFTTFLPDTFHEMRELTGRGLLYFSEKDWYRLANRNGFEILESVVDTHEILFESVKEILEHIKLTGVNSLSGPKKNIREIKELIASYPVKEGKFPLTYHSLSMILKKKDFD